MADVIIKGVEMPERCERCRLSIPRDTVGGTICTADPKRGFYDIRLKCRPNWCPLRPAPEWISVEERLPEKRKWVLCLCRTGSQDVLWRQNDGWYHDHYHQYMSEFVTHWMPLPSTEGLNEA